MPSAEATHVEGEFAMRTVLSLLAPNRRAHRARGRGFRPAVEALEARWCPTGAVFEWADPTGGALDPTFGSGGQVVSSFTNYYDTANSVTVQSDGKIVIAGITRTSGSKGYTKDLVARYNANGTLDTSFGSGGYTATDYLIDRQVALQPQASGPSKILVVGITSAANGTWYVALERLNANGTLDTTFGSRGEVKTAVGSSNGVTGVLVDGSGRILVAAVTTLLRYTTNGALDTTFGNNGQVATGVIQTGSHSLALQSDGKIVFASGQVSGGATGSGFALTRITANGAIDTTFGTGGTVTTLPFATNDESFGGVTLQSDGKIVVAGSVIPDGGVYPETCVLRYNADGSLDGTFASGGIAYLVNPAGLFPPRTGGVAIQSNGEIVVGTALSDSSDTQQYFGALRVSASGALDPGYGDGGWATVSFGTTTSVQAMALQPDGRVILAGYIASSGITDVALCRFLPSAPQIGSFTASAYTVTAGSSVTLTAANITDENSGSSVAQVAFYIMVNGNRVQLGYGTHNSDGSWSYAFDTTGYASGTYTLYAQATDNYGALGNPVALTLTIQ
jgi:uncharacterized delta-60 repeat protein